MARFALDYTRDVDAGEALAVLMQAEERTSLPLVKIGTGVATTLSELAAMYAIPLPVAHLDRRPEEYFAMATSDEKGWLREEMTTRRLEQMTAE
jgi:hypothetical protein